MFIVSIEHVPYLTEITYHIEQPGISQGQPVVDESEARLAANYLSGLPERTEVVDREQGLWMVWIPKYMTEADWMTAEPATLSLDMRAGGFRLRAGGAAL